MKLLLLRLALLVFFTLPAHAQMWVQAEKKPADVRDAVYDAAGNRYETGYFIGTAVFGNITLTTAGFIDAYIVKYDPSGNVLWAKSAGSSGTVYGKEIVVDNAGNAFITGYFNSTANFGTISLTSAGSDDIFIAKYNPSGNILWAKSAGGTGDDNATSIALDYAGNAFITGSFYTTANFGGISLPNAGGMDIFVAKYDPSGNILWAKQAGGTNGGGEGMSISTDGGSNAIITGNFYNNANFGAINLNSNPGFDNIFIAKYDSIGNILWAKQAGGIGDDESFSIAVDPTNNAYITGYISGITADFSGISLTGQAATNSMFIAKYDSAGNILWAKTGNGNNESHSCAIAVDANGNPYIIGGFFNNLILGATSLSSVGSQDIFVAKYDTNGNALWALSAGGIGVEIPRTINIVNGNIVEVSGSHDISSQFGSIILNGWSYFNAKIQQSPMAINPGIFSHNTLTLYPNPNTGSFSISGVQAGERITVRDIVGKTVLQQTAFENQIIQLPAGAKGLYFVQVGNAALHKVVVE